VNDRPGPGDELASPPPFPRRIAFLGSPELAVAPLAAMLDAGFDVPIVITGEPKRRGRGGGFAPTPVHRFATDREIAVSHRTLDLLDMDLDLAVVVAFGRLLRPRVLRQVPMINLHFSLLPRWRGAAPVERAIMAGDTETGVCLMEVAAELDAGAVYASATTPISHEDDVSTLRGRLVEIGSALLVDNLRAGLGTPVEQVGEVTYASKLGPEDFLVRLDRSPEQMWRASRVAPLWTGFRGKRLRLHRVEPSTVSGRPGTIGEDRLYLDQGSLRLLEVQIEGKAPQPFGVWRNGARLGDGERIEVPGAGQSPSASGGVPARDRSL
jgi:methionyl-tRNA formyltransferase